MPEVNFIKVYESADADKKIDLICKHYHNFTRIIDGYTNGLCYLIYTDKIKNRKSDVSELGVRVQNFGRYSDCTSDEATSKADIRKAVMTCDFSGDGLKEMPKKGFYYEMAYLLCNMRTDFEYFKSQLESLDDEESRIFLGYISKKLTLYDIADEEGIQPESAKKRVIRIKRRLKNRMLLFFEGTI